MNASPEQEARAAQAATEAALARNRAEALGASSHSDPPTDPQPPLSSPSSLTSPVQDVPQRSSNLPQVSPDVWHGPLADYVRLVTLGTEADPLAVYVMAAAGLGHRLGRDTYSRLGADRHPALLWMLAVGRTATGRKGTADSMSLGALQDVGGIVQRRNGLTSGEGLVELLSPATDVPDDAGGRLLIVESEWEAPLARGQREGSTLSAVLRQAWDCNDQPLSTLGVKPRTAPRHYVTVVGHITPAALRVGMGGADSANGFLNRFLLVPSRRPRLVPFPDPIPEDAYRLLEGLVSIVANAHSSGLHKVSDSAREWYRPWYVNREQRREAWPDRAANASGRGPAHLFRLALLLSVLDQRDQIELAHMRAAAALVDYSDLCAWELFGPGQTGDDQRILAALVRAGEQGMTREQVQRDVFSGHASAEQLTAGLDVLTRSGQVTQWQESTGGRPRTVYSAAVVDGSERPWW